MSTTSDAEFKAATLAFAKYIGIDIETEPELVSIARKALKNLPKGWEICISDEDESNCLPFFHNEETDESVWNHPNEEKYIQMVKDERRYLEEDRRYEKGHSTDSYKHRNDDISRDRRDEYNDYTGGSHETNEKYDNDYNSRYDYNDDKTRDSNKGTRKYDAYDDADDYKHGKRDRQYDYDENDHYDREHTKNKGYDKDDYDDRNKQDSQYDDYNYDDYDPDAELAKLNTSWGSDQYKKNKRSEKDDTEKHEDVVMIEVEEFNDDSAFDFMPDSADGARTRKEKNSIEKDASDKKRKGGGNAIFGDHWLDEADDDKSPDAGLKNRDDSSWGPPKHEVLKSGDASKKKTIDDQWNGVTDDVSKPASHFARDNRNNVHGNGMKDQDFFNSGMSNSRDNSQQNHRSYESKTAKSSHWDDTSERKSTKPEAVVDNWGMDKGRDRLQEERDRSWGDIGNKNYNKNDNEKWDDRLSKGNNSGRKDVKRYDDYPPKRQHYDDQNYSTSASPAKNYRNDRGMEQDIHSGKSNVQQGATETLRAEVSRLQHQIEEMRSQHSGDIRELEMATQSLRSSLQICEVNLQSERALKSKAESASRDAQLEIEKLRLQIQNMMLTPSAEFEALKRAEIENVTIRLTDEWNQKMKALEFKHGKEMDMEKRVSDNLRQDISSLEDTIREKEKQFRLFNEEADQKVKHHRESSSARTLDLESSLRSMETELSRVKEEYASMSSRAASALQQAKVAKAEADSLRAETSSIVSDGHTSHAALMQALQRIQQLETELIRSKTENEVLQKDLDNQHTELRKYQDVKISTEGKNQLSAMELKRTKVQFDGEVSRFKSRVAELEANNMVLQSQLDKASESEISSNRELQRRIDRSEHEIIRLQEKVREGEEKLRESHLRVANMEREVLSFQDSIYRKDRTAKDLSVQVESLKGQREQLRQDLESELESLQNDLKEEKEHGMSLVRSHQKEIEELKTDVEIKIPSIIANVTNQAEVHFNEKLQREIEGIKTRYNQQIHSLKHEIVEMQASHQEAVVRLKSRASNDVIETDAIRQKCSMLEAKNQDLSSTIDSLVSRNKEIRMLSLSNNQSGGYGMSIPPGRVQQDPIADHPTEAQSNFPHPDALTSIASELSRMRDQLNESMDSRNTLVRHHNDNSILSRNKINFANQSVAEQEAWKGHKNASTGMTDKENMPLQEGDNVSSMARSLPFTSSMHSKAMTEPQGFQDKSGRERRDYNILSGHYSGDVMSTPPSKNKKQFRLMSALTSPEQIFESPIKKPPLDSSVVLGSDFMHHDSRLYPGEDESILDSSSFASTRLNHDFSSIQDGGYHEGYWKAKYLRK